MSRTARPTALTDIQVDIGRRMRWARELVVPTASDFAKLCGHDPSTLSKVEAGDRATSVFLLREYSNRLMCSADFFLFGTLGGIEPELERLLITHHPELVLERDRTDSRPMDTAPEAGKRERPRTPKAISR
jgi:transcriptional regulator with XRE-family HTH domain